ncbi:MAG: hypothetical protein ACT4QF_21910 [Sporichthyaceae bacterium]
MRRTVMFVLTTIARTSSVHAACLVQAGAAEGRRRHPSQRVPGGSAALEEQSPPTVSDRARAARPSWTAHGSTG